MKKKTHQNGLGDLLTDDRTKLSEIGSADLADVKEAVCRQSGKSFEENTARQVTAQQRCHPTHQLWGVKQTSAELA